MKDRLSHGPSMLEVLDHDSLEQRRRDLRIPDAIRIHDHNWPVAANAEPRRLTTFDTLWAEQEVFPLQQLGEQRIELATTAVGRAKSSGAHEHMTRVRLHLRQRRPP